MKLSRVATLGAVAAACPALGDVLIGNLPGNDGTSTFMNAPAGGANGGGVHDSKAAGFTIPAGSAYTLDSVTLRLSFFDTASVPMVQLYSNAGTNPGTLIQTLTSPAISVTTADFVFTPSSAVTLAAGTTYWVVVWNNASALNSFRWMASLPSLAPTGVAASAGYRFSNTGPPPVGASSTLNSYAVNATVQGASCYPNCDNSTAAPILNIQDFVCFINQFGAGATYANCDLSTTPPVLNVQDFSCFLNAFGTGCS